MGGVGKTTLAKLVYNKVLVTERFDVRAWVCVSQEFDVLRVTKTILEAVTSSTGATRRRLLRLKLEQQSLGRALEIVDQRSVQSDQSLRRRLRERELSVCDADQIRACDASRGCVVWDQVGYLNWESKGMQRQSFQNCENLYILLPLGKLPSLKHFSIEGFDELVAVGPEFYENYSLAAQQFLTTRKLDYCGGCENYRYRSPIAELFWPAAIHEIYYGVLYARCNSSSILRRTTVAGQ
uniref:NB-ARC domain-containing protein n=1 Tax=Quercus lobata TaxID=97700 RepID=A0A7N2KZL3_QUELO